MRVHFPELYEAHKNRGVEFLKQMAANFGLTYEEFEASNWDSEGKLDMSDVTIDDGIPPPAEAEAPKRRGRPKGTSSKPAENAELLSAVQFIECVENDTFENS